MKKIYKYEIEKVNMVNGRVKDGAAQVYESASRLKVGNIYFHLSGLTTGGYLVLKEIGYETQ